MKQSTGKIAGTLVVAAVLAGAMWYWLRGVEHFDWVRFRQNLSQMDPVWLIAALVAVALSYVGRVVRWRVMLEPLRPNPGFWGILSATAIGFTATVLFGRAGEFVRPYLIAKRENVTISSQIAVWLAERIFDLLMVLGLFGFAIAQLKYHVGNPKAAAIASAGGWAMAFLSGICLIAVLSFRYFEKGVQQRLIDALGFLPEHALEKVRKVLASFSEGMAATRNTRSLMLLILYSLVEWVILIFCTYFTLLAMPGTAGLTLSESMVILGFVAIGHSVQLPGVGGGGQVATLFVLTELYNVPAEAASAAALVLWLVNVVTILPVGLVLAFAEGLHWKDMRTWEAQQP
ncbi:MAG: flippase-like domain-containing protein [Acidobacteria bacterium]|nr:flippase-like domain-containing protein [Acidobacteriota bacterium]